MSKRERKRSMRDRRREGERKERDVKDKRRFLNEAGGEESAH